MANSIRVKILQFSGSWLNDELLQSVKLHTNTYCLQFEVVTYCILCGRHYAISGCDVSGQVSPTIYGKPIYIKAKEIIRVPYRVVAFQLFTRANVHHPLYT